MDKPLSRSWANAPQRYLDRADVLRATVDQLQKDLALEPQELALPGDPRDAFEDLRSQVLPILERLFARSAHDLKVALYRLDIPEPQLHRAMAAGGLHALAGEVVLRALQKVLTRMRFAGRF